MKISICSPVLTIGMDEEAIKFYEALVKYIKSHTAVNEIENFERLNELKDSIDSDSLMVIFNTEKEYNIRIIDLLKKANDKGTVIWPVAMNKEVRLPNEIITREQSFDVKVRLENRNTKNMDVVAQIFAREIISRALPTFYAEGKKLLFVSHRRVDGEEIAAKLCDKINLLGRTRDAEIGREAFRDVVEVKVGEAAQDIIDAALTISDVLIFLHTPNSVNSMWIQKEVIYALLNSIPIVWVRIDEASIDGLKVLPSEKPHLECCSSDFDDEKKLEDFVNIIEDLCFKLVMNKRNTVWEQKDKFLSWSSAHGVEITEENKTLQIYKAAFKEKRFMMYKRRPIIQYLQYYGRTIKEDDLIQFREYLLDREQAYDKFDTAVMLSCNEHIENIEENIYKNGFVEHMKYWKKEVGMEDAEIKNKKIVICGAFPECEEYNKYVLTEALNIFSHEIISQGYTLVFGAHPTFQKLIFNVAQEESANPKQAVNMYISKFFQYNINDLQEYATICEVEALEDRQKSLTSMREKMLGTDDIAAVICLGGKIRDDVIEKQGVDEEIEIARKKKLPVFLVGTVGGLAERRANEYHENGDWKLINDADEELNEMFRSSLEYRKVFSELIRYIEKE